MEEKILFREESHVFAQCLKASEGCTNSHADVFLRIIEAIPRTSKRLETL